MLAEILKVIETYQQIFVGILGFGGVIWTLQHNARLARRQREDQTLHHASTFRIAILAELMQNAESFDSNLKIIDETRDDGLLAKNADYSDI